MPKPISRITGTVDPERLLPEGPFGDHLGYYSLAHDFPVLRGRPRLSPPGRDLAVYRRRPAAAGRHRVRAIDPRDQRAGHSQRHCRACTPCMRSTRPECIRCCWPSAASATRPTAERQRPAELLTLANAILGQGQLSLAKYLLIVAGEDDPALDIHDIAAVLPPPARAGRLAARSALSDLHTIDTLDYSGQRAERGLEARHRRGRPGAAHFADRAGRPAPARRIYCSRGSACRACWPSRDRPLSRNDDGGDDLLAELDRRHCAAEHPLNRFPLVVVVDDSEFAARIAE